MANVLSQRQIVEMKIIKACTKEFLSLGDLAEILAMNKHTLRAHYIYPLVKSGQLIRDPAPPAKRTVKYKCAG
jgi:hypothetical protein